MRLLVNWVYYQPIGHTIEALRFAISWRNANPDLYIAVAVNSRAAPELGGCVPGIDAVYPVDVEEFAAERLPAPSLERLPCDWDAIFTDPRHESPMGSEALDRCERAMRAHLRAPLRNQGWSLPEGFPGTNLSPLVLSLPEAALRHADAFVDPDARVRICLALGSGTEASRTPPLPFWRALIAGLRQRFDGLEIVLLGALDPRRSITQGVGRAEIDGLVAEFAGVRDAFDRGLLNQLAIAARAQLLISPHTGLGFATQAIGLPWLVLSGAWGAEYWLNGVPLVSIYPDCPRYPCDFWSRAPARPMLEECRIRRAAGAPYQCLDQATLLGKLPQILDAAEQLVRGELPYEQCAAQHYAAMIPRLGLAPGQPFIEGWPDSLKERFRWRPL